MIAYLCIVWWVVGRVRLGAFIGPGLHGWGVVHPDFWPAGLVDTVPKGVPLVRLTIGEPYFCFFSSSP